MEIWDVCDINKNIIQGRTSVRGSDDMKDDEFHIVVFGVVITPDKKLMVSKRHPGKMFGGVWEFNGGSAVSGETSRMAVERELLEETGLDISECYGEIVTSKVKYWPGSNWIYDVWIFVTEVDLEKLTPQENEVVEIELHSFEWVKEQLAAGNFTSLTEEFIDSVENYIKKLK